VTPLPSPQIVACYFDIGFVPPLAAMQLKWPAEVASSEHPRVLPGGEVLLDRLPERFGVRVRRQDEDAYAVTLLWGSTYRQWFSLRRKEIQGSALGELLLAMGTPLSYLLDQPVGGPDRPLPSAA
jgi:hypothetical protein